MMIRVISVIALGGALGSLARYFFQLFVIRHFTHPFPLGTLGVNLLGCFLIGLFYALAEKGNGLSVELRFFLTTGLCGGFTTFSTFSYETLALLKSGEYLWVSFYVAISVIIGVLATFAGISLVRFL